MKNRSLVLLFLGMLSLWGCHNPSSGDRLSSEVVEINKSAEPEQRSSKEPKLVFEKNQHDFGRVVQGEKVTFGFKFANEGEKDLLIVKVKATCGCTVIDYPRKPLAPGEKGVLHVTFNSEGKKGYQNKQVTVTTNATPSNVYLRVKANVIIN
ncbi:MAG: hypothetical protein CSA95_07685 [Bacteroidetes bacterium]|nr:MAG: hypothetical protein CSA95_07685 [Bacteroidota bacterium]